jgi:putative oxidoreductase
MKLFNEAYWAARIIAAVIMTQTLYFKFTGAEESVYIFTTVGMEPVGRIAVGILELVAAVLLIVNATAWLGALLGAGLMAGALGMHATLLGIEVKGDGGYLFCLALIVLICCCWVIFFNRQKINTIVSRFRKSRA